MFYSYEILQRRKGKFAVIWLAATNPRVLNRRDFGSVSVWRSCNEIESHICHDEQTSGEELKRPRLSLYLSSQLIYGISWIFKKQSAYLFEDIRLLWERVSTLRITAFAGSIDMLLGKHSSLQLDDTRFFNVDADFGYMKIRGSPFPYSDLDYFPVPSPHSSEEVMPSPEHEKDDKERGMFISPLKDITLPQPLQSLDSMTDEGITIPGVPPDFPPLDIDDLEFSFPSFSHPTPTISFPAPSLEMVPVISELGQEMVEGLPPDELTLADAPESKHPQEAPISSRDPEITLGIEHITSRHPSLPSEKRKRRIEQNEIELDPTLEIQSRKRRRRRLRIDPEISINREQIRHQLLTSDRLTMPLILPSIAPSANELFSRPGSSILSKILKEPWSKLVTQPVLDDPFSPETFTTEEGEAASTAVTFAPETSVIEVPLAEAGADISAFDADYQRPMDISEEIELPRETTMHVESVQASLVSLRDVSLLLPDTSGKIASATSSFTTVPLEPMRPIMEEMEPRGTVEEVSEMEPRLLREPEQVCMVSPIRTPPPSSPEPRQPVSPSCEKVIELLARAFDVSLTPGLITFRNLISRDSRRLYAAQTFSHLLSLHELKAVNLQQDEPYGDIFISVGVNF